MYRFQITLLLLFAGLLATAQNYTDTLTQKLTKVNELGYLPGFAVAIVSSEGVHYQQGFGYADRATQQPFSIHTLINIGSTSKTLLGIALTQLVEDGKLTWDTPINDILPFPIINPYCRKVPITVQHLATHTSSIVDPWDYERTYLFDQPITISEEDSPKGFYEYIELYNTNVPMSIPDFIESMMHPLGKWFKKKNFRRKAPGTTYEYSNMGACIAGYIVELVSGQDFQSYTHQHIIEPLGMESTGWAHDEIDESLFATLYLSNDLSIPPYDLISYADGGLITSVHDLSIYFADMLKGYKTGEGQVLNPGSYAAMINPSFRSKQKNNGRFWQMNGKGEIGHSGGDPGIMTFMMFDPETGIGRIIFTNKFDDEGNGINQLVYAWKTIEEYMEQIVEE